MSKYCRQKSRMLSLEMAVKSRAMPSVKSRDQSTNTDMACNWTLTAVNAHR